MGTHVRKAVSQPVDRNLIGAVTYYNVSHLAPRPKRLYMEINVGLLTGSGIPNEGWNWNEAKEIDTGVKDTCTDSHA